MNQHPEYDPRYVTVEIVNAPMPQLPTEPPRQPIPVIPPPPPPRRWLPFFLFIATIFSTFYVYILPVLQNDSFSILDAYAHDGALTPDQEQYISSTIENGMIYSAAIVFILLCHEMGHFLQAKRYGMAVSWPYFIPIPLPPIGTMGAVIVMPARIGSRRALFDVGITGPLAGLVPTLVCCVLGIYWSDLVHAKGNLGDPLLFKIILDFMGKTIPQGYDIALHPLAFAGWVGLFITCLNLMPIGQLDGGHILYALLRKKAHTVATLLLLTGIACVFFMHLYGWMVMIFLLILMGPKHPPTGYDNEPLGLFRTVLGWLTLAFIPLGFMPEPFKF